MLHNWRESEKSEQSYADFLRKFSVLREELHADPAEVRPELLYLWIAALRNMPLIDRWRAGRSKKSRSLSLWSLQGYSTSGSSSTIF